MQEASQLIDRFNRVKKAVETANTKRIQTETRYEAEYSNLKALGVASEEEAESRIIELEDRANKLEDDVNKTLSDLEEKYAQYL